MHAGGIVHIRGSGPHQVTRDFEAALCEYTGAPYAVGVTSCTMALLISCAYAFHRNPVSIRPFDAAGNGLPWRILAPHEVPVEMRPLVSIPKRTYVSVPQSIIHAGGRVEFRDEDWVGAYQLRPFRIWDCARRFTAGMFEAGQVQCVSFHWNKILGVQQGGAILHDDPAADAWLRRARFDGRREGVAPKNDEIDMLGWHAYLSPEVAAAALMRLSFLPRVNADMPNDDYPDLSRFEVFR